MKLITESIFLSFIIFVIFISKSAHYILLLILNMISLDQFNKIWAFWRHKIVSTEPPEEAEN